MLFSLPTEKPPRTYMYNNNNNNNNNTFFFHTKLGVLVQIKSKIRHSYIYVLSMLYIVKLDINNNIQLM